MPLSFLTDSSIKECIWYSRAWFSLVTHVFLLVTYLTVSGWGYLQVNKSPWAPPFTDSMLFRVQFTFMYAYICLDEPHQSTCWLYWLDLHWPPRDHLVPEIQTLVSETPNVSPGESYKTRGIWVYKPLLKSNKLHFGCPWLSLTLKWSQYTRGTSVWSRESCSVHLFDVK